jgi:predicted flap endonuclease-1-like 5' DNA nuclease
MFRSSSLWPGLLLGALSGLGGQGAGSRPQQQSDFGTSPEFFLLLLLLLVFLILLAWWALRRPPRGAGEAPAARPAPHAEPESRPEPRPAQPHVSKAAPVAEEPVASAPAPEAAEIQTVLPSAEPGAAAPVVETVPGVESAPSVEAAPEPVAMEAPAVETPAVERRPLSRRAAEPDDLRKIEGIGPKVKRPCTAWGITTFAQLAVADPADLETRVKAQACASCPRAGYVAGTGRPGRQGRLGGLREAHRQPQGRPQGLSSLSKKNRPNGKSGARPPPPAGRNPAGFPVATPWSGDGKRGLPGVR